MSQLIYAQELIEKFPEETKGFTVLEVQKIWGDYSETFASFWMEEFQDEVEIVFNKFRR